MAAFDKLYESAFMQKLQAWGGKLQSNKALNAISSGMMSAMGVILAGAMFTILATLLNLAGVIETTDTLYQWLSTPYSMTMGILSVVVSFAVGYVYSRNLGMTSNLASGVVTLILFLMVASPVQSVTLEDGSTMSVLNTTWLGGSGLFTALIIPLVAVRIMKFCQEHHIAIKMPEAVPQFLADAFASLVPLVINIFLWHGINTICKMVLTTELPGAITGLISIPLAPLTSVPGLIVLAIISQFLWGFGIHGTIAVYPVIMAPLLTYYQTNAELVAQGLDPVFAPIAIWGILNCCGGSGNVLSLTVMMLRAKSEQLRAVAKGGIVPVLFNLNEPIAFGAPIMYNPVLIIPFILNVAVAMIVVYAGYMIGFFQPGYLLIMTTLPVVMQSFMPSLAWQNLFIAPLVFAISFVIYYPFFKVYDRQLCEKEAAAKAEAEAQVA